MNLTLLIIVIALLAAVISMAIIVVLQHLEYNRLADTTFKFKALADHATQTAKDVHATNKRLLDELKKAMGRSPMERDDTDGPWSKPDDWWRSSQ